MLSALVVDVFNIEGVDVSRNISVSGESAKLSLRKKKKKKGLYYLALSFCRQQRSQKAVQAEEGWIVMITNPRHVKRILIKRSAPHPATA